MHSCSKTVEESNSRKAERIKEAAITLILKQTLVSINNEECVCYKKLPKWLFSLTQDQTDASQNPQTARQIIQTKSSENHLCQPHPPSPALVSSQTCYLPT